MPRPPPSWRSCAGAAALAAGLAAAVPARAQSEADARPLRGFVELQNSLADAEPSWLKGGFGKTEHPAAGGKGDRLFLSQAVIEWRPRLGFELGAVVSAQAQPGLDSKIDLDEAYLSYRARPTANGRLRLRAGLFFPPVSLENTGPGWSTPDTLSASAVNTWFGEESEVEGLEASYTRTLGAHELELIAAVDGADDTSGTLLTFRGWSLGEVRARRRFEFPLPELPNRAAAQDEETYPLWELDHRPGWYAGLEWRPPAPLRLRALYFDNRGDRHSVKDGQWSWATRYLDTGLAWRPGEAWEVLAQAVSGDTATGFPRARPIDLSFAAGYLRVTRSRGDNAVTARIDVFQTRDRNHSTEVRLSEHGWAGTLAWRRRLSAHLDLIVEGQAIASERPSRQLEDEPSRREERVLRTALRLGL